MAGVASSSSSSSEDLTQAGAENNCDMALNQLLQKRRCELMYELKRLEHGERPVTGTQSRDTVDSFFSRRLQRDDTSSRVANVDDVEEHRPEQVVIEVQGLLQRRSVSSVLQSDRFRRSLENVVRNHLGGSSQRGSVPASASPPAPPAPPAPVPEQQDVTSAGNDENISLSRSRSQTESSIASTQSPQNVAFHQPGRNLEDVMRAVNHDQLVMEISELVHRQLVSSTLNGNFRERLERTVMNQVQTAGHDGLAVQEHVLNLPPSNIRRNDFSHLGVLPPGQADIDDSLSVISATASATIPYVQSNAAVNRELSAMKAQIAQLSNMLKMSLDLQMDIQRSIKQEVAAAMSQSQNGPTAQTPQLQTTRAADSKCIVCVESDADAVLYRCGHICMCYQCALRMRGTNGMCPVCRAPITDLLRAYRITHE